MATLVIGTFVWGEDTSKVDRPAQLQGRDESGRKYVCWPDAFQPRVETCWVSILMADEIAPRVSCVYPLGAYGQLDARLYGLTHARIEELLRTLVTAGRQNCRPPRVEPILRGILPPVRPQVIEVLTSELHQRIERFRQRFSTPQWAYLMTA